MFSGIIKEVGRVEKSDSNNLMLSCETILPKLHPGSSVSINGVCLTVQGVLGNNFSAKLMPETLKVTTLGNLQVSDEVNLESALSFGDEIGGHLVYGHVDGVGEICEITSAGDSTIFTISIPKELMKYIVKKGAVAVDGVSLTVAECHPESFIVSIVQFTFDSTLFGRYKTGDKVNIEVDVMAKHLEKFLLSHPVILEPSTKSRAIESSL